MDFLRFDFIAYIFCSPMKQSPQSKIFEGKNVLDIFFSCFKMSVMTLNIFVLRKYRLIFGICHFISARSLSKTRVKNRLPLSDNLISVTVLYSTYYFFIYDQNCISYGFIPIHCRSITLLTGANKGQHSMDIAQRWKKAYLDKLIAEQELSSKSLWF